MDVNQEKHHAYAGYVGMVAMVEEMHKALFSPIWAQVRMAAPWESQALTLDSLDLDGPLAGTPAAVTPAPTGGRVEAA
jgi:hypothetical protein